MRIARRLLRGAWDRAREDAGLDRRDCVVFLVKERMPAGRAEAGYYRPGGPDVPHEWLLPSILRRVPPGTLERYENRHRVAVWSEIPGAPYALLGPLLRHELEHAAQWKRYGRAYTDLDGHLREVWDARSNSDPYLRLPSEREANLASARYAAACLDDRHLRRLRRSRRYRHLVDSESAALENDSLSLMVQALRDAGAQFLPQFDPDQRDDELRHLEQSARDWQPDLLDGLRDNEPHDLVVVVHPYRPAPSTEPVAEPLGLLPERE
jgi:hypothetical protein